MTSKKKIAIPVYKRIMHDKKGVLTEQPYGNDGEAIYSVSRAKMKCSYDGFSRKEWSKFIF